MRRNNRIYNPCILTVDVGVVFRIFYLRNNRRTSCYTERANILATHPIYIYNEGQIKLYLECVPESVCVCLSCLSLGFGHCHFVIVGKLKHFPQWRRCDLSYFKALSHQQTNNQFGVLSACSLFIVGPFECFHSRCHTCYI